MIAIIDYSTGNLRSVVNAVERLGASYIITSDESEILSADRVLLPGVGEALSAMAALRERGLDQLIPRLVQPVLGICIGMQLMCRWSDEGDTECMGIFENRVTKFSAPNLKIPQMGWNTVDSLASPLFDGIEEHSYLYYVHSYAANVNQHTIAQTDYGMRFSAALGRDNFYGCQFHPEKSGDVGSRILANFFEI